MYKAGERVKVSSCTLVESSNDCHHSTDERKFVYECVNAGLSGTLINTPVIYLHIFFFLKGHKSVRKSKCSSHCLTMMRISQDGIS